MEIYDEHAAKVAKTLHAKERERPQGHTVTLQAATPSQLDLAAQVARLQKENATLVSLAPLTCSYLHHDCVACVPNPNPNARPEGTSTMTTGLCGQAQ